jgi:excisionase family DNA binding protein
MRLLTVKEAARKLGVSTKALRDMDNRGEVESVRLPNGHRRFSSKEISRLMGEDHDILNGGE